MLRCHSPATPATRESEAEYKFEAKPRKDTASQKQR